MEGLASAETANKSATGGALVPLLTLGIPGSGTTAVLLGVLMMYGVQPGPQLMTDQPALIWTVIASLYISNIVLLMLNLFMIKLFVKILDIPPRVLMPLILIFALIGAYSINNSINDVLLALIFGVVGILMRATGLSPAIFILALVIGDQMEISLRQSLMLSNSSLTQFFTSPISLTLIIIALAILAFDIIKRFKNNNRAKYKIIEYTVINRSNEM